jgi:streptomycin 6-kinase
VIDVPPAVRRKALVVGVPEWVDALPGLVAGLEREWSLRVGRVFPDATEALVAEVVLEGTTPAVLKLVVPQPDAARNEATVLRLAGGRGCVRLLRDDVARGALLLERLGPSLHDLRLPVERRHDVLLATAIDLQPVGRLMLRAADRIAAMPAAGHP